MGGLGFGLEVGLGYYGKGGKAPGDSPFELLDISPVSVKTRGQLHRRGVEV